MPRKFPPPPWTMPPPSSPERRRSRSGEPGQSDDSGMSAAGCTPCPTASPRCSPARPLELIRGRRGVVRFTSGVPGVRQALRRSDTTRYSPVLVDGLVFGHRRMVSTEKRIAAEMKRWISPLMAALWAVAAAAAYHADADPGAVREEVLGPDTCALPEKVVMSVVQVFFPGVAERFSCRRGSARPQPGQHQRQLLGPAQDLDDGEASPGPLADPHGELAPGQEVLRTYTCRQAASIEVSRQSAYGSAKASARWSGREASPCPIELHVDFPACRWGRRPTPNDRPQWLPAAPPRRYPWRRPGCGKKVGTRIHWIILAGVAVLVVWATLPQTRSRWA